MHPLLTTHKKWRYKNTFLLIASLVAVFIFINTPIGKHTLVLVSKMGYLGAFIVGIFFVSTFTVAPAGIVLFAIAKLYNPLLIALCAGLGAVLGDYIIFRFLRDGVFDEIKPIFIKLGGTHIARILSTPYFAWLAPVFGALIIASPFPDEIGVGLMGISKLKNWQFLLISFLLNSLGILFIITAARSFN